MKEVIDMLKKKNLELPENIIKAVESRVEDGSLKKKDIEKVLERIVDTYEKARIESGEGVGVLAAQSIGEPGTQMMMRTKHYAGTAMDITRGLPRLIEIFDARSVPKTPMMSVYLDRNHNTAEKAEKLAHSLKETKLKDVAKEIQTNFLKSTITVILDKNELKKRGVTPTVLKKVVNEKFEKNGAALNDKVIIKGKKKNASALQKLRDETKQVHLSGVSGISYVVIQKEGNDYVIYTKGTNLKDVLEVKGVDPKRTLTNDIMEIGKILGIEAARNSLVYETQETLKEAGLIVDNRHVTLVADTMTADGVIKAIGRHGVSGNKASVLARASFEETVKHLLKAGAYGETDNLNGVVENIIVGQVINLGTGIPELIIRRK